MPRWPNSAPPCLYCLINHDLPDPIIHYTNKRERDKYFKYLTSEGYNVTKMDYLQKEFK